VEYITDFTHSKFKKNKKNADIKNRQKKQRKHNTVYEKLLFLA